MLVGGALLLVGICAVSMDAVCVSDIVCNVVFFLRTQHCITPAWIALQLASIRDGSQVKLLQNAKLDMHTDVTAIVRLTESR